MSCTYCKLVWCSGLDAQLKRGDPGPSPPIGPWVGWLTLG